MSRTFEAKHSPSLQRSPQSAKKQLGFQAAQDRGSPWAAGTGFTEREAEHIAARATQDGLAQEAAALRGAGELSGNTGPLPTALSGLMERHLGFDFSQIQIHKGESADQQSRALGAYAFTRGRDISFAANRWAPRTHDGIQLLTHELVHVVQQGAAPPSAAGGSHRPVERTPGPMVQCSGPADLQDERMQAQRPGWLRRHLGGVLLDTAGAAASVSKQATGLVDDVMWGAQQWRRGRNALTRGAGKEGAIGREAANLAFRAAGALGTLGVTEGLETLAAVSDALRDAGYVENSALPGERPRASLIDPVSNFFAEKNRRLEEYVTGKPVDPSSFSRTEIAELTTDVGITVGLSLVGAKEVELALQSAGIVHNVRMIIDAVQRSPKSFAETPEFWSATIGTALGLLGIKDRNRVNKLVSFAMKHGWALQVVPVALQMYQTSTDPNLSAMDKAQREKQLFTSIVMLAKDFVLAVVRGNSPKRVKEREHTPSSDAPGMARDAAEVGMDPNHVQKLQQHAANEQNDLMVVMRASNKNSLAHHEDSTTRPKPHEVETLKTDKKSGLVVRPKAPTEAQQAEIDKLTKAGWSFDEQGFLRDPNGKRVFGDYDMQGVYHEAGTELSGKPKYRKVDTDDSHFKASVNAAIGGQHDMIQHGANDNYYKPYKKLPQSIRRVGRQPGTDEKYLIVDQHGTRVVNSTRELQQVYRDKGIPWMYDDYHPVQAVRVRAHYKASREDKKSEDAL